MKPHVLQKHNKANRDFIGRTQQTRPALAAHNTKRVQSITWADNHMSLQNRNFFKQQPPLTRKPSTR